MFRKICILSLPFFLFFFSFCKKKNQRVEDNIAYQTVNVTIYPNDPLYFKLQTAGGWVYYDNAGINGLIIYRKTTTNNPGDFVALERTSTYLPDDPKARVKVQSDNFTLKDTISGSKWQIFNGAVMSGPATQNLRLYNAVFDGINTLTIRN
ncbi:MAG: hypothetical protein K0R26_238 [Bacteroidota bacterium]|jgi:hypothetical protein|nr:hypothetical protein [Bacteroidota bacterium]